MATPKKDGQKPGLQPDSQPAYPAKPPQVERLEAFEQRIGRRRKEDVNTHTSYADQANITPIIRKSPNDIVVPHKQVTGSALRFALQISDIFWVAIIIMACVWNSYIGLNDRGVIAPIFAGLFGTTVFAVALLAGGAHKFSPIESYWTHMRRLLFIAFASVGVWLSAALILKPVTFRPDALALAGLAVTFILFVLHSFYFQQIRAMHETGSLAPTIVMLGATDSARRLIEQNAKTRELNILAIFDDRLSRTPADIHGVPVVGRVDDLLTWDAIPYVNRIVVTLPSMAHARKREFVEKVRQLPNRIAFVVDQFENLDHVQQRLSQIADVAVHDVSGKEENGRQIALKRLVDVVISGTVLLVASPIMALIAVLIKSDSPGPVLFKQERHGFNNRIFEIYKFRSLRVEDEDKQAAQQVMEGDSRVTRIGRFIRKTSLDELPQLINVLKGDMSLVGPRPHAVGMRTGDTESYKLVEEYAHRHKVKPGMTGWAQINGSRGPLHDVASVLRRVQLDMEYIELRSIRFDFMIMFKTVPCLLGDSENIR